MADYVAITDTQVDPDAPLTSQLAYQWRDNPIAITEGAAGAPRNRPLSLDLALSASQAVSDTETAFTGLAGQSSLLLVASATSPSSGNTTTLEIDGSEDNGATWLGEWYTVISATSSDANPFTETGLFHISLTESRLNMVGIFTESPVNAIRFRRSVGAGRSARVHLIGLGRT